MKLRFTADDIEALVRAEVVRLRDGSNFVFADVGEIEWSDGRSSVEVDLPYAPSPQRREVALPSTHQCTVCGRRAHSAMQAFPCGPTCTGMMESL
jgi:hypothetical protein